MENDRTEMNPRMLSLYSDTAEEISHAARALSVHDRVSIRKLLSRKSIMSVNDIAKSLELPLSSVSLHIRILEEAGLIVCERMSSLHGTAKMCSYQNTDLLFRLGEAPLNAPHALEQDMPLGAFVQADHIAGPCGLASSKGPIAVYNRPVCFFLPERLQAQVLWFKSGRLVYHFAPFAGAAALPVREIECSFEACSHAEIEEPWETRFSLTVNDVLLGSATCACEMNGRRGKRNPDWWPDVATQYGTLFRWQVNEKGCRLQGKPVSDVTIADLGLEGSDPIRVAINVPDDSDQNHGINLFGSEFGDYSQGIRLMITYTGG